MYASTVALTMHSRDALLCTAGLLSRRMILKMTSQLGKYKLYQLHHEQTYDYILE